MHGDSSRRTSQVSRDLENAESETSDWPAPTAARSSQPWSDPHEDSESGAARMRLARLARAIECDVIPRLIEAHRPARTPGWATPSVVLQTDVQAFVRALEEGDEARLEHLLTQLRRRGATVEAIYLELFTPAARQLGEMWSEDECDFPTVTVALGHLQRLLRELNPDFGAEHEAASCGHRILFVQPRDEQHSLGLSMLAEFFRREGWTVLGGVGGAVKDPVLRVRNEWVDVLGYSVGSDRHIDWLVHSIRTARAASCNPQLVVLVGGPLFIAQPELANQVGADATAADARGAPALSERLLIGSKTLRK